MPLQVTPPRLAFPCANSKTYSQVPALMGLSGSSGVPDLIREAATLLETYSPGLDRDLYDALFTDYGNLALDSPDPVENGRQVGDACRAIIGTGAVPFFISEDSRHTPLAIRATLDRFPDLMVIQIGARPNLLGDFEGEKWHSRTSMSRTLDRLPSQQLKQLGIRSGTKAEFQIMREGSTLISVEDLTGFDGIPIYLTFDLNIFDPAAMSAVYNPEPGGIFWEEFAEVFSLIPWDFVKGCDVSGLVPSLDSTGFSTLLAAKVVREMILAI